MWKITDTRGKFTTTKLLGLAAGTILLTISTSTVYAQPNPSVVCNQGGDLQARIDNAPEGATIFFGGGTCEGPFTIRGKSVNLRGFSSGGTLSAPGGHCVLNIEFAHAEISRLEIDATGAEGGICVHSGTANIHDTEIKNSDGTGIFLFIGASAFITDNIIENSGGVGIQLDGGVHALIENNVIRDNLAAGIFVRINSGAHISNNVIDNNEHNGVGVVESSSAQITANMITGNGISGVSVERNSSVEMPGFVPESENFIEGNGFYGLHCDQSGSLNVHVPQHFGTGNNPGNELIDFRCHKN